MSNCLNLGAYLAETALKHRFCDSKEFLQEQEKLKDLCLKNMSIMNMQRLYLRLQKMDMNRIIVNTVLQDLSEEKREFVIKKYRHSDRMQNISLALNVSLAQLNIWDRSILAEISRLMFYNLTSHDVFARRKIINLLYVLDLRLLFFEEYPSTKKIVDRNWLRAIDTYRDRYQILLDKIEDCINQRGKSVYYDVIATKIEYPLDNIMELSSKCYVSIGSVSRHLKRFQNSVAEFVQ